MDEIEFIEKYCALSNGGHIKLNEHQKEFLRFNAWLKEQYINVDQLKCLLSYRHGRNYLNKLMEKYNRERILNIKY